MKSLLNIAIASTTLLLSTQAFAAKSPSQNEMLGHCKTLAKSQFDNVKKVKLSKLKHSRGTFEAKLKVIAAEERGMFLCTIERDQEATIVRLDQPSNPIAAKQ